jgi:PAS domain S-box-containing protein
MTSYDPLSVPSGQRTDISIDTDSLSAQGHSIFFAAVETTRMPMIITDPRRPDNPIVFANRAFLNMTGYAADEIVGRNCRFLQGPDTDAATLGEVRAAVAAEREIATEILNYRKDGGSFWNALFISPVRDKAGNLIYFFASQLDVSRRRDAEDALRQAQKMEALGQLTGGIAHDFNNLLQIVFGHLDILRLLGEAPQDARRAKSLQSIRRAAEKAKTLTQQLLAFARKQQLQGRIVNLNALTTQFIEMSERTLGEGIDVATMLEPELWNCRIDPTQAEVALLNILLNARDAMQGEGKVSIVTSNVEVAAEDLTAAGVPLPGRYVCMAVSDSGHGIPAEALARVMEPFFTTKDEGAGTGLGLSMVYGFAKQSGGAASIYSEVGSGTTVRMYFPATDESMRRAPPRASGPERSGNERIVVVDDRVEVAEMTELMLSSLGYRTEVFTSASEALRHIESGAPLDVMLTDLIMPGRMNGVMLARRARQHRPGLKVLLTTGFADASLDRSGASEGEFEVIYKPYGQEELARRVRQLLLGPTGVG